MSKIQVLDPITIDKIAAGEVIERPSSVIKELVENAIDAGASAIVVEIKEGGTTYMRISDNGCGIPKEEVPSAFLRHSTSKIRKVEDLMGIGTLGFRGEALSSIAAVAQVELLTKTKDDFLGTRYRISGGKEEVYEDAGAKDGTTFIIRQLFYNTPARKKFLKTPMTEASHISDLMARLALSHPEISFQFINNGQSKINTSGNGKIQDVIYHIYGRDVASNLLPVDSYFSGLHIYGVLGKPIISRGNRNFETYFVNKRYVKSTIISRGIEDGYKGFTMQHKYPFVVLHIDVDGNSLDVNVHPTKMELRFDNQQAVYQAILHVVEEGLHEKELISFVALDQPVPKNSETPKEVISKSYSKKTSQADPVKKQVSTPLKPVTGEDSLPDKKLFPGDKEKKEASFSREKELPSTKKKEAIQDEIAIPPTGDPQLDYFMRKMQDRVASYHQKNSSAEVADKKAVFKPDRQADRIRESVEYAKRKAAEKSLQEQKALEGEQMHLFEDKLLEKSNVKEHKIIGQLFDTYWLVEFHENLYIIDQHAAHEKVLYEKTLKGMKTRDYTSQMISPPIVLNLTMQEAQLLRQYIDQFTRIGFEIEEFGQDSFQVCALPDNLFSIGKKDLLIQMIDELSDEINRISNPELIDEKIASMSCKAAVKGNMKLSLAEVDSLIGELLTLENPYHCPHGRPTIIAMSKTELEKKFKRIV
ncbi:MAG: DNA mismatch repair endonuclease MutL [Dorea sp.]|nr:DNA mismatch repair endonuclease MutL [Dorea sp.]